MNPYRDAIVRQLQGNTVMDQRHLTARQFGDHAANYLSSTVHAQGADLTRLTALAQHLRPLRALDLGCGAGHAAFALARGDVPDVVAFDLSARMLEVVDQEAAARGHGAITTRRGSVDQLPFDDASFELITTRYSAHHWPSVSAALREAARVLTPGGRLVIIDVIAPESALLDTTLQTLEVLRDMSHVRDYRLSEWRALLHDAGFSLPATPEPATDSWKLMIDFASWVERIATPLRRIDALRAMLDDLPLEVREYFVVAADGSFSIDAAWIDGLR